MARRSNKTAHVLNLIAAGHDTHNDSPEDSASSEIKNGNPAEKQETAAGQPEPPVPARSAAAPLQNNISVIDTTTEDPVSDLIQQQLNNSLKEETMSAGTAPVSEPVKPEPAAEPVKAEPAKPETAKAEPAAEPAKAEPAAEPVKTETAAEPAKPETAAEPVKSEPAKSETAAGTEPAAAPVQEVPAVQNTEEGAAAQKTVSQPEPEPEPVLAPDFVRLNVMESIVNDKIIYYMRQFDVCTCDRCVADTAALTLNGLLPKYIVTTPAAVDPLLSYYTNRLISDVTVEATKACMIVKENPRH